jgi:hypothetical protein
MNTKSAKKEGDTKITKGTKGNTKGNTKITKDTKGNTKGTKDTKVAQGRRKAPNVEHDGHD